MELEEFIQVPEQSWRAKRMAEAHDIADRIYRGNKAIFKYRGREPGTNNNSKPSKDGERSPLNAHY